METRPQVFDGLIVMSRSGEARRGRIAACALVGLTALVHACRWAAEQQEVGVQRIGRVRLLEDELCHVVGPGETVWSISELYGVDAEAIRERNALHGDTVRLGALMAIPAPTPVQLPPSSAVDQPLAQEVSAVAEPATEASFAWPVYGRLGRRYGDPTDVGPAGGIDLAADAGAPVQAAKSGQVRYVGQAVRGLGKVIVIDHGGGEWTLYGHLGSIQTAAGERVVQGQCIGTVGRTGRASSDRLHFRVYRHCRPLDPLEVLP